MQLKNELHRLIFIHSQSENVEFNYNARKDD